MLDVGSPFDFANQGVLYLPKHLPEPGREGVHPDVLEELGELTLHPSFAASWPKVKELVLKLMGQSL